MLDKGGFTRTRLAKDKQPLLRCYQCVTLTALLCGFRISVHQRLFAQFLDGMPSQGAWHIEPVCLCPINLHPALLYGLAFFLAVHAKQVF
jgi:hypothetical protein